MDLSPHILVVEADAEARRSISDYLGEFDFRVSAAINSVAMRRALERGAIDLVLLDIKSPAQDGVAMIRELRAASDVPIIVLGNRGDTDRIIGLEVGADDYITKPYNLRELVARIRTILRRAHPAAAANGEAVRALRFAHWELDVRSGRLQSSDGQVVELTRGELALLRVFLDAPEQTLSREQLLESVRRHGVSALDRRIDVQVLRLRRKIEADPARPRLIRTERGSGYFLDARVSRVV